MIQTASELLIGLMILGAQTFALLLMILGAIDLWGHFKEKN